jgi:hypothetical protein
MLSKRAGPGTLQICCFAVGLAQAPAFAHTRPFFGSWAKRLVLKENFFSGLGKNWGKKREKLGKKGQKKEQPLFWFFLAAAKKPKS